MSICKRGSGKDAGQHNIAFRARLRFNTNKVFFGNFTMLKHIL